MRLTMNTSFGENDENSELFVGTVCMQCAYCDTIKIQITRRISEFQGYRSDATCTGITCTGVCSYAQDIRMYDHMRIPNAPGILASRTLHKLQLHRRATLYCSSETRY